MTPERWRQVTEVFHAARARDGAVRASYLEHACAGDGALRAEVDAMLAAHHDPGGFADQPVSGSIDAGRRLEPGAMVGAYRIDTLIGAGGMGEVYRARDTKLGRDVAIKVLPAAFTSDLERLARFEREARMLAALNHPHIGAIYGLEDIDGVRALVLELVEGPTLADRVAAGPTPVKEAVSIARQIAEALEAAHEKGIIHRDLKPANVKVTPDGAVKVLDFGLAKACVGDGGGPDLSQSPTVSVGGTCEGTILGTPTYMSPEQARGQAVDKRTDIWAFGCVLYEMLTGQVAFRGGTISDTIAAILDREPTWGELPTRTPPKVRDLLRRCLQKDPTRRLRDIGDARMELEDAQVAPTDETGAAVEATAVAVPRLHVWQRPVPLATAIVSLIVVMGLASWTLTRAAPPRVVRFTMTPSGATPLGIDSVVISPDGTRIAYVGAGQIVVRAFDQLEPTAVLGVGGAVTNASLFFSPDGQWIGFADNPIALKKVAVTGGPPTTVSRIDQNLNGASWSTDDTIIYARGTIENGLLRVAAAGGQPEVLTTPNRAQGELYHSWPEVLPEGQAVLFTIATSAGPDSEQVAVLDLRTRAQKVLIRGGSHARYVPTGHLVYGVAGTLRAVAFDLSRLEVVGTPVPVLEQVMRNSWGGLTMSLSRDGTLVYVPGGVQAALNTLVWVDRQGREEALKAPLRGYSAPRLSPDGARLAVSSDGDLWIWDLARETLTRVTFEPTGVEYPVWTPDGRRLAFRSKRLGQDNLFWQAVDGTGSVERLTESSNEQSPHAFSRDGKRLFIREERPATGADLALLTLEGERRVETLVQTPFSERNPEISPDGRWLAYQSDESGQFEIYVRPFPDVNSGRWQISTGGGSRPLWAPKGGELFYAAPDGTLMRVPVEGGSTFRAGNPTKLFAGRYSGPQVSPNRHYDISPDGQRFLMIKRGGGSDQTAAPPHIVVVQNWFEELKRLVPTK